MADNPLVDAEGRRTDDPVPLIVDPYDRGSEQLGAILPLGPKGLGWLIFVDVLAGIASGGTTGKSVTSHPTLDEAWTGGFFLMAINVGNLQPLDNFKAKVDGMIRNIKRSRKAQGFDEVVVPGERAQLEYERRSREGVPVREEHWDQVKAIAAEVGVDLEALRCR
jgi:ureidoglycolate dehydrogenase (NAD+)